MTGLNASTSPWFFLSSLASLSISFSPFLPLVLPFSSFVSRPPPSLSTIPLAILVLFLETLLHLLSTPSSRGALPVPGLCRGLGGKRVGLAIIPKEARQTLRIEQLFEISVRYPSRHRKLYLTAISPSPPNPPSALLASRSFSTPVVSRRGYLSSENFDVLKRVLIVSFSGRESRY